MGQDQPLFVYFRPFLNTRTNIVQNLTINGKSIDGVLGIQTEVSICDQKWLLNGWIYSLAECLS